MHSCTEKHRLIINLHELRIAHKVLYDKNSWGNCDHQLKTDTIMLNVNSTFSVQNPENNTKGLFIEYTLEPKVTCRVFRFDPNRIINDDANYLINYQHTGLDFEILEPARKVSEPDQDVINVVHDMNSWLKERINIGEITV